MRLLNTTNQEANKKISQLVRPIDDNAVKQLVNKALYVSFADTPDKLEDALISSKFKAPSADSIEHSFNELIEDAWEYNFNTKSKSLRFCNPWDDFFW